ncbi:MAG: hypothetical protein ACE364_10390 [Chlorobiota bacterium]
MEVMKLISIFILLLFVDVCTASERISNETNENWYLKWNIDSTAFGYKDVNGNLMIDPIYWACNRSLIFENIVPVIHFSESVSYFHLTKHGEIVGEDSTYIMDNCFDCESEGFIRFRDPESRNVGLFNRCGEVVIPAEYNTLSKVRNGILIGRKGSTLIPQGEHTLIEGGTRYLIDTLNNILVEDIKNEYLTNLYSLEISEERIIDSTKISYLGVNGKYYTFTYYEKEFEEWFHGEFAKDLSKENLLELTYDTLSWNGLSDAKEKVISENFEQIVSEIKEILTPGYKYFISQERFAGRSHLFEKFRNNCGEYNYKKYPYFEIVKNSSGVLDYSKEFLNFIITDDGYKLLSVRFFDEEDN